MAAIDVLWRRACGPARPNAAAAATTITAAAAAADDYDEDEVGDCHVAAAAVAYTAAIGQSECRARGAAHAAAPRIEVGVRWERRRGGVGDAGSREADDSDRIDSDRIDSDRRWRLMPEPRLLSLRAVRCGQGRGTTRQALRREPGVARAGCAAAGPRDPSSNLRRRGRAGRRVKLGEGAHVLRGAGDGGRGRGAWAVVWGGGGEGGGRDSSRAW